MGELCNSRPSYCEVLVQLVRDLSGPRAPYGCMLLDTVYKASVSGVQVRRRYRSMYSCIEQRVCSTLV